MFSTSKSDYKVIVSSIVKRTISLSLITIIASFCFVQLAFAANRPRISRRDTLRQVSQRRLAVKRPDERSRTPKNYRPTLGSGRWVNGRYKYSTHYQTTNRSFHTNSGRRTVQDRAGRLIFNSNRTQMIRRRSTRHKW